MSASIGSNGGVRVVESGGGHAVPFLDGSVMSFLARGSDTDDLVSFWEFTLPAGGEADLHYAGQSFELMVPVAADRDLADEFHRVHEARYGYADRERPIELVAVRTAEVRPAPPLELPPAEPLRVEGPALLELEGATCFVAPGWVGVRDGTDPALRPRSSTLRLTRA